MTKISIVVPVYNVAGYLERCINSILRQKCENLEILIIDDGSTDGSERICDNYKKIDNIRVIHQRNSGVSIARNVGLSLAHGEWVMFIDGDDFLPDNAIEKFLLYIDHSIDIILADFYLYKNGKKSIQYFYNNPINFTNDKATIIRDAIISNGKICTNIGVPWSKLYRLEFLKKNCIQFKSGLKRMQDTIFNLYAFEKADRIIYIHSPVYIYVSRKDSAVHKYTPDFDRTANSIITELEFFSSSDSYIKDWENIISSKAVSLFLEWCKLVPCHSNCNLNIKEKLRVMKYEFRCLSKKIMRNDLTSFKQRMIYSMAESNMLLLYLILKLKR